MTGKSLPKPSLTLPQIHLDTSSIPHSPYCLSTLLSSDFGCFSVLQKFGVDSYRSDRLPKNITFSRLQLFQEKDIADEVCSHFISILEILNLVKVLIRLLRVVIFYKSFIYQPFLFSILRTWPAISSVNARGFALGMAKR